VAAAALAACGGKAIIDGPLPSDGGASASGATTTSTGVGGAGTTNGTSATSGPTGSSSGGASVPVSCDDSGSCAECSQCATAGPCADQWASCLGSQQCGDLFDCVQNCSGGGCFGQCLQQNPGGAFLFLDAFRCTSCDACEDDCAGTVPPQLCDGGFPGGGPGGPGGPGG
jgi:hypothetical protein